MKSFSEFQEEMNKKVPPVTGLGGGGGGTDSIMAPGTSKSLKKRIGDVAKVLTFPFHKRRKDPTEKFASEEVAIANSMSGGGIAGSVEADDDPPVNKKKKKGEPTIIARGLMPGARGRFKTGADFISNIRKNKYT